jgi:hypothetical protein
VNVLHAPKNVGSHPSSLAQAENAVRGRMGMPGRSWSVNFSARPGVAPADEDYRLRERADEGLLGKAAFAAGPLLYGLGRWRRFDVLHLNFGESLFSFSRHYSSLEMLDLPLWKLLGKRLFMTFQGCDVRQKGLSAQAPISACRAGHCDYAPCDARLDARRRRMVERVLRFSDKVFCLNPDLVRFVPAAEFLPYANLERALLAGPPRSGRDVPSGLPTVVHAPTNRSIKGTAILERVSRKLQASVPHRLVMVEGRPREEVLEACADADLVVDQLLVGWYGGFAVEAMALGIPVVAYLDPRQVELVPAGMRRDLPILGATPDSLEDVLGRLLSARSRLREAGERSRAYVRRWHDPEAIARRMLRLYEDPGLGFWEGFDVPEAG